MNSVDKIAGILSVALVMSPALALAADQQDALINKVEAAQKQIFTYAEDAGLTTQVKASFVLEPDIESFDIQVNTTNHIVYLSGTVDTQLQANKAIELAQSVTGVEDVDDTKLKVMSSDSFLQDAFMTAKVKGKIMQLSNLETISKNNDLHVETTNGMVHIFGKVDNQKDINSIEQAIGKMSGIKGVKTNIDVMKK